MSARAGSTRRRNAGRIVVLAAAIFVLAPQASAMADNNYWEEPFGVLLTDEPITDSNFFADEQPDEPLTPSGDGVCGDGIEMVATKWYRFVGNGGRISVNTVGSDFDTVIAAYYGPTPRADDPLPCSNDAGGFRTSALSFQSIAGRTYLIQLGGCSGCNTAARGNIVLNVHADPPPQPAAPPGPPPPAAPPPAAPPPPPPPAPSKPEVINARSMLATDTYSKPVGGRQKYLGLQVESLKVSQLPRGTRVRVWCSRLCAEKPKKAGRRGKVTFDLDDVNMPTGTRIFVTAKKHGWVGAWIRYIIRPNKLKKLQLCLYPGKTKPRDCSG
jgi:hypothetical protein